MKNSGNNILRPQTFKQKAEPRRAANNDVIKMQQDKIANQGTMFIKGK